MIFRLHGQAVFSPTEEEKINQGNMLVHENRHWSLKHREDSKLPGYLILTSKVSGEGSLSELEDGALEELGRLQVTATMVLESVLQARLVYVCRWGHQPGHAPHFHIVPLYGWVERAYAADHRWTDEEPDGPVLFKYITIAFTEDEAAPPIHGPSVEEVVGILRQGFAERDGITP